MRIRTKSNLRGLKDIRTRSGRVDSAGVPYMAYMKIGCLEMEKARREKEKFSSQARINNIEARLGEIEAEKSDLLCRLGERPARGLPRKGVGVVEPDELHSQEKRSGFKIRY